MPAEATEGASLSSKLLKATAATAAAVVIAVGAYWYWSPYLAMNSMKTAAQKQDADAFNEYVDYPRLRESFKGQFGAKMADVLGSKTSGGSDAERAGSAFGAILGMAFVDKLIDAMVRPEMVMKAWSAGRLQTPGKANEAGAESGAKKAEVRWVVERKGVDRILAYGAASEDAASDPEKRFGFVFERSGVASWKLVEVRLPADK